MKKESRSENLFSYGTLQKESVQFETFGRKLTGSKERLIGYKLEMVEIKDEEVLRRSGLKHHPIITPTRNRDDVVEGSVFQISSEELRQADEYEVDDYKRVLAECESGIKAWVYIATSESV